MELADPPLARVLMLNVLLSSVVLPERERHDDYSRHPVPADMLVPEIY